MNKYKIKKYIFWLKRKWINIVKKQHYCKICEDEGCVFCSLIEDENEAIREASSFHMPPTFKGNAMTEEQKQLLENVLPRKNEKVSK